VDNRLDEGLTLKKTSGSTLSRQFDLELREYEFGGKGICSGGCD